MPLKFKPTFSSYVSQYAGQPTEEFRAIAEGLVNRYIQNKAIMDELDIMAKNEQLLSEFDPIKQAEIDKLRKVIAEIDKTGAYENADLLVSQAAKEYATNQNLNTARSQTKQVMDWLEDSIPLYLVVRRN